MLFPIRILTIVLLIVAGLAPAAQAANEKALRVAVLENSPPMAYRDASGALTGFSVEIIRALCEEMRVVCAYQVTTLDSVLDEIAAGEIDIAAISLLDTPERRARILFAKPYFRSISLWFAKPGIEPGQAKVRVAVVRGSAQERFARSKGWETVAARTNGELAEPLRAGVAQAAIIPMSTGLNLMKNPEFRQLELVSTVMNEPELGGDASFGISPRRPELKEQIDAALERIKRNGTYDRINSQFLPFRIN
ncbi:MAG: transporter substrate-binding domain-containing protein [Azonexus sp.]|nr:transporter substrate-binding domain-containing protein [Azonexus sp.]